MPRTVDPIVPRSSPGTMSAKKTTLRTAPEKAETAAAADRLQRAPEGSPGQLDVRHTPVSDTLSLRDPDGYRVELIERS